MNADRRPDVREFARQTDGICGAVKVRTHVQHTADSFVVYSFQRTARPAEKFFLEAVIVVVRVGVK